MKFGESDSKMAAHAYMATLTGIQLGDSFLAKVNAQIMEIITILLHYLLSPQNSHKRGDFIIDLESFVRKVKVKYSSDDPFGYSPLSPFDKRMLDKTNELKKNRHNINNTSPLKRSEAYDLKNIGKRRITSNEENKQDSCSYDELNM
jgi:hypothetical protein